MNSTKTKGYERALAAVKFIAVDKSVTKEETVELLIALRKEIRKLALDLIFEEDK